MAWNSWFACRQLWLPWQLIQLSAFGKSALFDRLCTPVRCPTTEFFLCGRSSKTFLLASLSGERCSGGQLLSTFSDLAGGLGLESLKITSARCFLLKGQRKHLKKAKEHCQFRGVFGRWRTAAIDRTTFHACQRCRKTAIFAVFSRLSGVIWRVKAFRDQQCQFLTRNKSLSSESESNCSMTSECVRTDSILPWGTGLEHGRRKQSIFSLSIFGILVERLSF